MNLVRMEVGVTHLVTAAISTIASVEVDGQARTVQKACHILLILLFIILFIRMFHVVMTYFK